MSNSMSFRDYNWYTYEALDPLIQLQDELDKGGHESDFIFLPSAAWKDDKKRESPKIIFKRRPDKIQLGSYVGQLSYDRKDIMIHSRFDGDKHFFQRYMMETSLKNISGVSTFFRPKGIIGPEQRNDYLWYIVCQLAMQLQEAWKKGTFRIYQGFDHYDSRMRGQLDIPRHIRLSMGMNDGRLAYRTREYSPDNPYNRLFLCAMNVAERRYPQMMRRLLRQRSECKAAVQFLRAQLPGWEQDQPYALMERTRQKITHPIYRDYEDVRLIARAILHWVGRESLGSDRAVGMLLDMNQLWEKFLENELFESGDKQSSQSYLDGNMKMRPDLYWKDKGVVLDAKYRPAWGEILNNGRWSASVRDDIRKDIYQVFSYMLALDCRHGGVIFPVSGSGEAPRRPCRFHVSDLAADRNFWLIPFVIPNDASDYEDFQEKIKRQKDVIILAGLT